MGKLLLDQDTLADTVTGLAVAQMQSVQQVLVTVSLPLTMLKNFGLFPLFDASFGARLSIPAGCNCSGIAAELAGQRPSAIANVGFCIFQPIFDFRDSAVVNITTGFFSCNIFSAVMRFPVDILASNTTAALMLVLPQHWELITGFPRSSDQVLFSVSAASSGERPAV